MRTWTVGGVISGFCSIGSPSSATTPKIIVTMAMTLAKIGRSMKNRENMKVNLQWMMGRGGAPGRGGCLVSSGPDGRSG